MASAVGIVGLRQSGKTTLHFNSYSNIADHANDWTIWHCQRRKATRSPKTFLEKLPTPVVLDEVQKAPPIFDAIKLKVDRKRIPGSLFPHWLERIFKQDWRTGKV